MALAKICSKCGHTAWSSSAYQDERREQISSYPSLLLFTNFCPKCGNACLWKNPSERSRAKPDADLLKATQLVEITDRQHLHQAVFSGSRQQVKRLLCGSWWIKLRQRSALCSDIADAALGTSNVDLDLAKAVGITALHFAVLLGNRKMVKCLIKSGCRVDSRSSIDYSIPLHLSVETGNDEIAHLLLSNGADGFAKNAEAVTPFEMALDGTNAEMTKCFLVWLQDMIGAARARGKK